MSYYTLSEVRQLVRDYSEKHLWFKYIICVLMIFIVLCIVFIFNFLAKIHKAINHKNSILSYNNNEIIKTVLLFKNEIYFKKQYNSIINIIIQDKVVVEKLINNDIELHNIIIKDIISNKLNLF